jgi:type II secretory pathway pseudopilin PulG
MTLWIQRVAGRLRRGETGFTLVELVVSMAILMTVMGGVTGVMVSGTNAQIDQNNRFQAQTEARLALDYFRREVHCASSASTANPAATVTLTLSATCPTAAGSTSATWCTVANGTGRYGLWRYSGSACSGTGRKVADYLTTSTAFTYFIPSGSAAGGTGKLASLQITLDVNLTPAKPERVYALQDTIVLRNSTRPA